MTELVSISDAKFSARATHVGAGILLELTGAADATAKRNLARMLGEIHEHAKALGAEEVRMDIRRLTFMNTSCFKDVITWLDRARADARYRITFLSSATQHWQKRSLHALSCFARDLVSIEAS